MRYARTFLVATMAAAALVVPSTAGAQISSISIGDAQLGPQGASLSVPVTVQCDFGWGLSFVDVTVVQRSGHFLAQGFGGAGWGVPCVGPGTRIVNVTPPFGFGFVAFKAGHAEATATVGVFNLTTFNFFSQPVTQTLRVSRQPITYVDPLG